MRSGTTLLAGGLLSVAALAGARQDRPAPQPTFRTGVDLIQLDVSVLDKDRRPVQGLTAADFTVLVDGQPRPIVAFRAVELPKPIPPSAPWIRDVAPDVATNTRPSGRVVVIMIDDGSFGQVDNAIDLRAVQKAREVARAALNELGPDDLAAVVYTENNHTAQNFTIDRRRLLAAIDTSVILPAPPGGGDPLGIQRGSCSCGLCSIEALGRVAEALRSLPQQRKIVIFISPGVVVEPEKGDRPTVVFEASEALLHTAGYANETLHCNLAKRDAMTEVFRQAQLANVTIQAVDPKGLAVGQVGGALATSPTFLRMEFLRTMAETTGGRAVVNNNDMERQVSAVLAESSAYYLVGIESGVPSTPREPPASLRAGRFYPIQVRVNRPGLEVRTRKGYYAPTAKERKAMTTPLRGLEASIAAALPKSDFPMDVSVAPFAGANRKAELAVVLAVMQPADASRRESRRPLEMMGRAFNPENVREPVDVMIRSFNPESGKALGTWRQRMHLRWNPTDAAFGHYEVMSRVPVSSGRYELRLGLQTGDGRTASVYTYVEVPDFAGESLSLSGLVLSATPSPRMAPKDAFAGLMPVTPTARRVFQKTDRVTAFLRVYQGGSHPLVPVTITTRLVDSTNAPVGDGVRNVDVTSFSKARSFDNQFDLPVRLPRGEYLLSADVAAGGKTAQRTLRFRVE
jgi:VWFA-related protein